MTPAERLERCNWDLFWVAPDTRRIDRPELLAVGCDRPLPHLNIVRRILGPEGLDELVLEARALMHPGCSRFFMTDNRDVRPLERTLAELGYVMKSSFDARIARVDDLVALQRRATAAAVTIRSMQTEEDVETHERVTMRGFGMGTWEPMFLAHKAKLCRGRQRRYLAEVDGVPLAAAGLDWFPDWGVVMFWGGCTVPEARGKGLYRALVRRRLDDARALGAEWAGLYARTDTSSPIVDALGFTKAGEGWYWGEPSDD